MQNPKIFDIIKLPKGKEQKTMIKNYKVKGKVYEVDMADIKEIQKDSLTPMSELEAVRGYFEEMELIKDPNEVITEVEEVKTKRTYAKSDKPRKATTKERKVNENKKVLIEKVVALLNAEGIETEVKTETEIKFAFNEKDYTFKLTEHRKPKK